MPTPTQKLLTVREVAEQLSMSEAWVRAHASQARRPYLPSMKLGKCLRFRQTDIDQFLQMCEQLARGIA